MQNKFIDIENHIEDSGKVPAFDSARDVYAMHFSAACCTVALSDFRDGVAHLSVMGVVNQIAIDEGRLEELELVLRLHFPEYFTDYKPFNIKE